MEKMLLVLIYFCPLFQIGLTFSRALIKIFILKELIFKLRLKICRNHRQTLISFRFVSQETDQKCSFNFVSSQKRKTSKVEVWFCGINETKVLFVAKDHKQMIANHFCRDLFDFSLRRKTKIAIYFNFVSRIIKSFLTVEFHLEILFFSQTKITQTNLSFIL